MKSVDHPLELTFLGGLGQAAHVARDGHGGGPVGHGQLLLNILGHIHQDWTGPACSCQVECLLDDSAMHTGTGGCRGADMQRDTTAVTTAG